ncbi:DUF551 domain-containing protein [Salmonella enterica subsp. enterica serovar Typhimurium var. 5-]|nr:DUF551 domain-containing protein [Salmonella enterica subsp. enterica serovar Typhimurium]EBV9007903.1 DUF551 domain-containing protein [Salmonella enterica subsp. enterica serovar Typhimurium var. 5-]ECS1976341.1 DUF551 domain-containing protein [Salmonella enterica subsp. enterica serovar Typhimurium var. 5-]
MTTITKERIELFVKSPLENGLTRSEQMELARIALVSLTAEPVAWMCEDEEGREYNSSNEFSCGRFGVPLYASPPAPVVPEDISGIIERFQYQADHLSDWRHIDEHSCKVNRRDLMTALEFMDSCRAAMLQGKFRDLSQPVDPQVADYEKTMLQAGNSPVTPGGWISCSERMPAQDDWVLIYSKYGEYLAGQVQGEYVELNDGTLSWLGAALHWMPLPEPPQQ